MRGYKNIRELSWDESGGKMEIDYTAPGTDKLQLAVITFGEKSLESIFDKLARKAAYTSPDMLNDLARLNIEFEDDSIESGGSRLWLLREIDKIAFGGHKLTIEMSTEAGHNSIIPLNLFVNKIKTVNIPAIHNIQVTGKINPELPHI